MSDGGITDSGIQGQLAQISMKLGAMEVQLGVIDTKLSALTNSTTDHETRIRALETAKAKIIGGAASAGVLSGGIATLIYWALQHH